MAFGGPRTRLEFAVLGLAWGVLGCGRSPWIGLDIDAGASAGQDAGAGDEDEEESGETAAETPNGLPPLEGCPQLSVPAGPACPNPPITITTLYQQAGLGSTLAVDDQFVFLVVNGGNPQSSPVLRMDKCGNEIDVLTPEAGLNPAQMALSSTHVVWTDFIGGGAVYSVSKAGGPRIELARADNPLALTVIGDDALWGYQGIFRMPVTGGLVEQISERTAVELIPRELDVFVSGIDHVGRLSLDTGAWQTLYDDIIPDALQASCDALYWGDEFGNLVRGTLDGSSVELVAPAAYRLTRDEDWIYATNIDGELWAVSVEGSETVLLAEGLSNPFNLAIDRTHIYWTRHSDGSVTAMPNPLR